MHFRFQVYAQTHYLRLAALFLVPSFGVRTSDARASVAQGMPKIIWLVIPARKPKNCDEKSSSAAVWIETLVLTPNRRLRSSPYDTSAMTRTVTSPMRSMVALAMLVTALWSMVPGMSYTAPARGGLNRKQMHGNIHNKDKLPGVIEIPLDEEEPELDAKPEMPEKRVPYSMHIVSQLPQHKHLHEESNARKFIEDKVVGAFENFEGFIRHVEVHLQVARKQTDACCCCTISGEVVSIDVYTYNSMCVHVYIYIIHLFSHMSITYTCFQKRNLQRMKNVHTHMYICMCIRICTCMYIYIYICVCACM